MKPELAHRLTALQIEVSPDAATVHLARIGEELRRPASAPGVMPRRRRLVAAFAAGLIALLPAGVAVAAENTVPGDALHPVKEVTEWMRSFVDPTVAADHRVDELEILIDRQADYAVIAHHLERAETAVSDHPSDFRLHERLDAARDRIERDYPITDWSVTDHTPTDVAPIDRPSDESYPVEPRDGYSLTDRPHDGGTDAPAGSTPANQHDHPDEGPESDGRTSDRLPQDDQ